MKLVQRTAVGLSCLLASGLVVAMPAGAVLDPVAVTVDDAQFNNGEDASMSADGRFVAYTSGDTLGIRLFDAVSGESTMVDAEGFSPAISADGNWIAFSEVINDQFEVVRWNRSSGVKEVLSSSERISSFPTISANGGVVAWVDSRQGASAPRLVRVWRQATGQVEDIRSAFGLALLSGDGRYLFYADQNSMSVRRDLTSGSEQALEQLPNLVADVSDDGDQYAYIPFGETGSLGGIARHTISTGEDAVLSFSDEFGIGPQGIQMSGDGSTLFVTARPDLVPSDTNDSFDLYRWMPDVDALDWTDLRTEQAFDLSSDGRIVVTRGQGVAGTEITGPFFTRLVFGAFVAPPPAPDPISVDNLARTQLTDQVSRLYSAFFLRPPDEGGLAFWRDQRAAGASVAEIADRFAQSPEFVDRYGNLTNTEFVELIYQNLFDRQPDSSGGPFWTAQLIDGLSRGSVMVEFSESPEYVADTGTSPAAPGTAHQVWRLYRAYFGRDADQGGFDFWYGQAFNGRSITEISDEFARSPEFAATYGDLTDAEFVDLVYQNVLQRSPDTSGRQFWVDQLAAGTSRGSVMLDFSESVEYIKATDTLPV